MEFCTTYFGFSFLFVFIIILVYGRYKSELYEALLPSITRLEWLTKGLNRARIRPRNNSVLVDK